MKLLRKYCKPYLFQIVLTMILKIISTGFTFFLPWAFAHLINEIVPLNSNDMLMAWAALMIFAAFAIMILSLWSTHLSVKFGVNISQEIREDVLIKSCDMDCEKIDRFGISSIISRLTTDIASIQTVIAKIILMLKKTK